MNHERDAMKTLGFRQSSGLWWTALVIILVGSGITFMFSLDKVNPGARIGMAVSLMLTIFGTGICVISATAGWWMHR